MRVVLLLSATLALTTLAAISPMPYRPGYGLGSWLPPAVVESMRQEAERRVEIMTLENADAEVRSVEREIALLADTAGDDAETKAEVDTMLSEIRKSRRSIMTKKMDAVRKWLASSVNATANATNATNATSGAFATFMNAVESPLDWKTSTIEPKQRSFDSINIGVHYVRATNNSQRGNGTSHAEKVGRELKNITHSITGRVTDLQRDAARLAADKTANTEANNHIVGTLIINAFATHRNVLQITNMAADADKLWRGWNHYFPHDRIPDPLNQHEQFKKAIAAERDRDLKSRPQLSMVSEMYTGSVIIGMVHFVSTENTSAWLNTDLNNTAQKFNHDLSDNVRQAQKAASAVGSTTIALEAARKMANLGSSAGLNVQFDLVCIGYIPKLQADPIQQAVAQFATFDPAQFAIPSTLMSAPTITGLAAVQSNMAAVIDATVSAIQKTQDAQKDVLTEKSLMTAFTDFADASRSGNNIGAPIGMNSVDFTKLDVMSQLANKYLNTGMNLGVDLA